MSEKLKPCPFCGNTGGTLAKIELVKDGYGFTYICCRYCGARGGCVTKREGGRAGAITAWNNRKGNGNDL